MFCKSILLFEAQLDQFKEIRISIEKKVSNYIIE